MSEETEKKDAKKLIVDQEACIGCGACVNMAPEYFKLNDEGKSEVIKSEIAETDKGLINEVISSCPVQVISIR